MCLLQKKNSNHLTLKKNSPLQYFLQPKLLPRMNVLAFAKPLAWTQYLKVPQHENGTWPGSVFCNVHHYPVNELQQCFFNHRAAVHQRYREIMSAASWEINQFHLLGLKKMITFHCEKVRRSIPPQDIICVQVSHGVSVNTLRDYILTIKLKSVIL